MEWVTPIQWFGAAGYIDLDGTRRAKVELSTVDWRGVETPGYYPSLVVTILDVTIPGSIDQHMFPFDQYLSERSDNRPDWNPSPKVPLFRVSSWACGWNWYVAEPRTTRPLTEAIERYIEVFRHPARRAPISGA